jgi:putative peptide zinc metalloprotease protein
LEVTQEPRSPWTGAYTDEAFVPLGVVDEVDEQTGTEERPPEQADGRRTGTPEEAAPVAGDGLRTATRPAPPERGPLPPERRPAFHEQAPPAQPPARATPSRAERAATAPSRRQRRSMAVPARGAGGTAADFTAERYLRSQGTPPRDGWRRVVYWLTGGRINLGPSPAEVAERRLMARAKAPVAGCRSIAVISRKGGVGKTTTTLMLGHTFASLRGDRVVALDGNPDAGSLGYRVRKETVATITNLLADEREIVRYADIRSYTNQAPTRLEVVASDDDPRITKALGEEDYRRAITLLERHYNLICLDTGTGVLESATKGILQLADQIVVVMAPSLDSARAASSTLDWLNENGHAELVQSAVAVINAVRGEGLVEVGKIEEHFAGRCRAVVQVPWDPHLDAGAETQVERLRPATRRAYLEVAAAVADGFGQ